MNLRPKVDLHTPGQNSDDLQVWGIEFWWTHSHPNSHSSIFVIYIVWGGGHHRSHSPKQS